MSFEEESEEEPSQILLPNCSDKKTKMHLACEYTVSSTDVEMFGKLLFIEWQDHLQNTKRTQLPTMANMWQSKK